jgi:hypothetical protein
LCESGQGCKQSKANSNENSAASNQSVTTTYLVILSSIIREGHRANASRAFFLEESSE